MAERKVGADRRGNAGKGRPKGSRNKTTVAVKEALSQAFDEVGGVKSLKGWAEENPTEFYKLWAKLLPTEVQNAVSGSITVTFANE